MNQSKSFAQIIERKPGEFHLEIIDSHCKETVRTSGSPDELSSLANIMGYFTSEDTLVDTSWLGVCETGDILFPLANASRWNKPQIVPPAVFHYDGKLIDAI